MQWGHKSISFDGLGVSMHRASWPAVSSDSDAWCLCDGVLANSPIKFWRRCLNRTSDQLLMNSEVCDLQTHSLSGFFAVRRIPLCIHRREKVSEHEKGFRASFKSLRLLDKNHQYQFHLSCPIQKRYRTHSRLASIVQAGFHIEPSFMLV